MIQVDDMDADLRNGLWDALTLYYWPNGPHQADDVRNAPELNLLCQRLWHSYFKLPIDTIPWYWSGTFEAKGTYEEIRTYFFDCAWYEVYDIVEFIANNGPGTYGTRNTKFTSFCNTVLERELSGYRFVGGRITQVTSKEEISEIEEAQLSTGRLKPVSRHLTRALELLADRNSPDYRNSIKEAISAVEAICNLIAESSRATLGQALRELDRKNTVVMHPALRGAFEKLYGYTSNAESIRHALLDESNLDFEDAKFMLVSCSAFVHYLKSKSAKAGITL